MKRCTFCLALAVVFLTQLPLLAEKKDRAVSDKDFLTRAVISGVREVRLSDYAVKNATDEKVKDFAQHMVTEHTAANNKLTEYSKQQKLAVVAGQEKETRDMLDRLTKLQGQDFDREYMKMMVEDHQKAVRLFESQAKDGSDNDLKTFAAENLPIIKKHLQDARAIYDRIKK